MAKKRKTRSSGQGTLAEDVPVQKEKTTCPITSVANREEREREGGESKVSEEVSVTQIGQQVDWMKVAMEQRRIQRRMVPGLDCTTNMITSSDESQQEEEVLGLQDPVPVVVTTRNVLINNKLESSVGNASALTKTQAVLEEQAAMKTVKERKKVKEYVLTSLFKKVKFLASDDMLDNCVKSIVEKALGVTEGWWWKAYRGVIKHAISEKRSNITSDMRRRFEKGKND